MIVLLFSVVLAGFACASESPPTLPFTWSFHPENVTQDLLPCGNYSIQTTGNSSIDGGQFNLRAFSPNVTPIFADVGNNASNLQWDVPFPPGFQVMLGLVDGNEQSGEVKGPFSVNWSLGATSCLPVNRSSTSSFKVTTNVTSPKSCEPIGIFISGGNPPYNATIVIEGAVILSRPMNSTDDVYTWFNVALAGRRVIFSAEDKDGKQAASSNIISSVSDANSSTCTMSSYSSKSRKTSAKALVKELFFLFGVTTPLTLLAVLIVGWVVYEVFAGIYYLSVWTVISLYRFCRRGYRRGCWRGDAESGSVDDDDDDSGVETRPHTPVGQGGQQRGDSRPNTPPGDDSVMLEAIQTATPHHSTDFNVPVSATSLPNAVDEKVQDEGSGVSEKE